MGSKLKHTGRPYNPWYTRTYEKILAAANWGDPLEDVELKIALVFSWMPTVIMRHREGRTYAEVRAVLKSAKAQFGALPKSDLWRASLTEDHRPAVASIFDELERCMGGVAASKFLHFTRPRFFPMFDRKIANIRSGNRYYDFMIKVHDDLQVPKRAAIAKSMYRRNLVRGWDLHLMVVSRLNDAAAKMKKGR